MCFNRSKKYSDTETLKKATKNLKFWLILDFHAQAVDFFGMRCVQMSIHPFSSPSLMLSTYTWVFVVRKNGKNSSKKGCECAVTTLCPFLKRSKGGIYKTLNNPRWFDNNVPSILHSTTKMCMLRIFLRLQISGRVASWFLTVYDFVKFWWKKLNSCCLV